MKHSLKHFVYFLVGLIVAAGMLSSCETRKELESRMDEIVGEYRLAGFYSVAYADRLDEIPKAERDAATARIFPNGKGWIFEYTLPLVSSDNSGFSYHRVRQPIVWEPQLGEYYFYQLDESDFAGCGIDPAFVSLTYNREEITFQYSLRRYTCIWGKIR